MDTTRRIIIAEPYPAYRTVVLYAEVWVIFFVLPLFVVYASLTGDTFRISEFGIVCLLGLVVVVRFGAVASLSHVLVQAGFLIAFLLKEELRPLLVPAFTGFILLYSLLIVRAWKNIWIMNASGMVSDGQVADIDRKARDVIVAGQKIKRRVALPVLLALTATLSAALWYANYPEFIFLFAAAVLMWWTSFYTSEYDRLFLYDNAGQRYYPYFAPKFLDQQLVEFIRGRGMGLFMFCVLYGLVIMFFGFAYYYVDNCESDTSPACKIIDTKLFNSDQKAEYTDDHKYRHFTTIDPRLGCNGATGCALSLRRFQQYLYFSVVTTTTVGYGDIAPRSVTAVWLVILHHLIAVALLLGLAGQVAGIVLQQRVNLAMTTKEPAEPPRSDPPRQGGRRARR